MLKQRIPILLVMTIAILQIVWIRSTYQIHFETRTEYFTLPLIFVVCVGLFLLFPDKPAYQKR